MWLDCNKSKWKNSELDRVRLVFCEKVAVEVKKMWLTWLV